MKRSLMPFALLALIVVPASAQTPKPSAAEHYFTNVELLDQNGETVKFYDDLLRGKVVVINTFFASCHGSCPIIAAKLAALQSHFHDRLGKDLLLISLSVDPEETPATLKTFARKFDAQPGWFFLTGKRENVTLALKKLGQFVEDKNDHVNILLIGNDKTGLWKKAFGLGQEQDLINAVQTVLDDRG